MEHLKQWLCKKPWASCSKIKRGASTLKAIPDRVQGEGFTGPRRERCVEQATWQEVWSLMEGHCQPGRKNQGLSTWTSLPSATFSLPPSPEGGLHGCTPRSQRGGTPVLHRAVPWTQSHGDKAADTWYMRSTKRHIHWVKWSERIFFPAGFLRAFKC